jgi:putative endonuclease
VETYFTYIIESKSNFKWYIGHTNDINRRIKQHITDQSKSTKNRGPWTLIFIRKFDNKVEANRFELELKRLRNKDFIRNKYSDFFLDK